MQDTMYKVLLSDGKLRVGDGREEWILRLDDFRRGDGTFKERGLRAEHWIATEIDSAQFEDEETGALALSLSPDTWMQIATKEELEEPPVQLEWQGQTILTTVEDELVALPLLAAAASIYLGQLTNLIDDIAALSYALEERNDLASVTDDAERLSLIAQKLGVTPNLVEKARAIAAGPSEEEDPGLYDESAGGEGD